MDDCPNCEYHRQRAQLWREEAYRQAGHPLPDREQEPVVCDCDSPSWCKQYKKCNRKMLGFMPYVAQPQRTWVGLTDEERKDTLQSVNTGFVVDASVVALAIEAKLKEKNT